MKDLTHNQWNAALSRNGIRPVGFLGYYDIGNGVSVSVLNAGQFATRRAKLAWLLRRQAEEVTA